MHKTLLAGASALALSLALAAPAAAQAVDLPDLNGEEFFSICGKNIVLNTGHHIHDTLIPAMTEYVYSCIDSYERNLGDEFDWIWDNQANILKIIWRPENDMDKVLTIFIEERADSSRVLGSVYYKTGYFD